VSTADDLIGWSVKHRLFGRGTAGAIFAILLASSCGGPDLRSGEVPEPDMTDMETQVKERLKGTRAAVLKNPDSALAWGQFGKVAHAHELWAEAAQAYQRAQTLDPSDVRWPYYLGDVLSIQGTELASAEAAFRRTLELRPGYAPAHMRLGNLLVASGKNQQAEEQFERALDLEPELQPAQVALAQIRLGEGQLEFSEMLLTEVLTESPRHPQALAALGQVYMRQGRRDEAREIAERARSAALYNLFSDPLMGEVDREGRSTLVIWERAKAFLENGNSKEAVKGLLLVVELQPTNADAHQQLAIAYGNLGNLERSRDHLERAVFLDPEWLDPRIQLAAVYLEIESPAAAIPHLQKALKLAPAHSDTSWLLGKAQLLKGETAGALATFERAMELGLAIPAWAHNEWGSALAQSGRPDAAGDHFVAALEEDPENAQALFYLGLLLEGAGEIDQAVDRYCRSLRTEEMAPTVARLRDLGRNCS
jgi:tetratricopeptide (TPR) repeat protein